MKMESIRNVGRVLLDFLFPPQLRERRVKSVRLNDLSQKVVYQSIEGLENTYALLQYRDRLMRDLIWVLKYRRNRHAAALLAHVLYSVLLEDLSDHVLFDSSVNPIVIPMPLARKRKLERGFNQVELVTSELEKLDDSKSFDVRTDILMRTKDTPSQTSLKKQERKDNVRGVFYVAKPQMIKSKYIILVDDVITTGSTMTEARSTLLAAGARGVTAIAIAH